MSNSQTPVRPIFVHAMWRTGSTYVWNKFRQQPGYRAYYEPLHEIFIDASPEKLRGASSDQTTSVLRHPHLEASYFTEYEDFIRNGHAHFEKKLPYQRYCLDETEDEPVLRMYLAELLVFAMANGQIPVLQFNRSLLRTRWLTGHFRPVNILLLRRPIDVWKSFVSFQNLYFPTVACMVVGQDRRHPLLTSLATRHGIPFFEGEAWDAEYNFYHQYAGENLHRLYPLFYELYLLTSVSALRDADCIIDLNKVTESAASKKQVAQTLCSLGIDIALDDCRLPVYTDLTEEDRECVDYEPSGRTDLRRTLPRELLVLPKRLEMYRGSISQYFQDVFSELSGSAEDVDDEVLLPSRRELSAADLHREGLRLFEEGNPEQAGGRFRDAILQAPSAELWNDWASAHLACRRPQLAELGYRRARDAGDLRGDATTNLAALLAHLGRHDEAIPLLKLALRKAHRPEKRVLERMLFVSQSHQAVGEALSSGKAG